MLAIGEGLAGDWLVCGGLVVWLAAAVAAGIAGQERGRVSEGVLLGICFGPLGVIMALLLRYTAQAEQRWREKGRPGWWDGMGVDGDAEAFARWRTQQGVQGRTAADTTDLVEEFQRWWRKKHPK